jgi:zinc protease
MVNEMTEQAARVAQWAKALLLSVAMLAGLTASAAPLTVPEMPFRERTLANGLRVLSSQDSSSPTASIQVWYQVGSKDDPQGRSGFAHLFEHMMFKTTKYMQNEQLDRMTEDVGGANNAFTADDMTAYHEVVPSNHLERLLWAEAERMANLTVDEAVFKSERDVVKEEYRQRVLADPYGRLYNSIAVHSYAVHPYKRPGIGNIAELDASSISDVRNFHKTFYRPDNAVLIVTGDFEPKQLDAWVDQYFAGIKNPATPIPRVTAQEPARKQNRVVTEKAPNVPLPAVALTWLAPPVTHKDSAALRVVAALLGGGESSRLHEALVYRTQIARQAGFEADLRNDTGLLTATVIAAGGKSPAQLAKAAQQEIAKLAAQRVSDAELDKVKTQLLTAVLLERQTPLGKGMQLGLAVTSGNAKRVNTDLVDLQAVTPAEVQRVTKLYLTGARSVTVEYLQDKGAAKSAGVAIADRAFARTIEERALTRMTTNISSNGVQK